MLWFKNLRVYRLSRALPFTADQIETHLSACRFTPCGSQDKQQLGFVAPAGKQSENLLHASNGQFLVCVRKEEKMLPATVVRQNLEERVQKIEQEQQRKLKKTEKDSLKDEVLHHLLPRAFSRFSQTWVWMDPNKGLVIVDSASAKKAEDTLALLRKSLGSLPVVPIHFTTPIELTLTEWVRSGIAPSGINLLDEAELKATLEEGGVIRCKKQQLVCDEIAHHIESGKRVTKVALDWRERVQLVLAEEFAITRLKFSETLKEQNDDINREDAALRFDADFVLMTGELSLLIDELIQALGGENDITDNSKTD